MTDENLRELLALQLPYTRKAEVREFTYDSGLKMLRLVLREGKRITQVELDAETAAALGQVLSDWAEEQA